MAAIPIPAPLQNNTAPLFASLMPTYLPLDGVLLETASLADSLILESSADHERLQLYNVAVAASPSSESIFFLPLRLPTIGEEVNFDYIGTSNLAFFILRGAPGIHFTHCAFVGYHGDPPTAPMLPGCLIRLPTPPKFLVAIGDWQITANAMLASASLMMMAAAGKRPRDDLQDASGVQTSTGEVAAVKTYLEDLDGGRRSCRDMAKSSKREVELGPVWRLTMGRELDIAGRGHVLQAAEYLQAI